MNVKQPLQRAVHMINEPRPPNSAPWTCRVHGGAIQTAGKSRETFTTAMDRGENELRMNLVLSSLLPMALQEVWQQVWSAVQRDGPRLSYLPLMVFP